MDYKRQLGRLSLTASAALFGLSAVTANVNAEAGGEGKAKVSNNAYIVQMADMPVSAYAGGIQGLNATKLRKGQKIDPNAPAVVSYMAYLAARQDALLNSVGGGRKLHSYGYVFNGFAADLTPAQAAKLAATAGVLAVSKDEARALDTATTPTFLGLNSINPPGIWASAKGEGVVIGIVDGGIWPEHPSFSDRTDTNGNGTKDGKLGYQQLPGWNGKCTPGEAFNASHCNQKLIGARYYNAGFGGNAGIDANLPWEFNSPRDYGGHGTHTASTAGGNQNVPATGAAAVFGSISGIAPRARIAAYKVCWQTSAGGSCFQSDSVAAIDQAVADGVDVINFSISGSRTNFRDAVEIAFLFAADAGVFVAASAGNSGPNISTVAHPGPWLTTVAAGTHNRNGTGSVTLGNAATYAGASLANALASTAMIDSALAGLAGADPAKAELCYAAADNIVSGVPTPVLDPAKIAGKIVLCKRGATALVNKSGAVAAAGGTGAILYNDPAGGTNTLALMHAVPTVHVVATSGLAIKTYIASFAPAMASIAQAAIILDAPAPLTATFSSRGPLLAGAGDLLKPDLIAPGQDILAGVAPPGNGGKLFDLYSGTSMSSPHVAGLAALFKELKPTWSPMAIKSALMTTGADVLDTGLTTATRIFRQGAGHVQPNKAMDPGLVFDSGFNDWLSFICGVQPGGGCTGVTPIDASNLNVASIAIGDMLGVQTVARRVTNVGSVDETYTASYTGVTGFSVTLPGPMTIAKGATVSFNVGFLRTTATPNDYRGGQITLTGNNGRVVRIPVVVRAVALIAPATVAATPSGVFYGVTFGFDGPFSATARGLVVPTLTPGSVTQDPDQTFVRADATGTVAIAVTIPVGATYARFALFDADVSPGSDLDVFVYQGTTLVGSSTRDGSTEEVNFTYATPLASAIPLTVYVHGWFAAGGSSPFKLHQWTVGTAAAGNMNVVATPATAVTGASGNIAVTFTGLMPATKYLGTVAYGGTASATSPTVVSVNTP